MPTLVEKPPADQIPNHFKKYVDLVPSPDLVGGLQSHGEMTARLMVEMGEERAGTWRYQAGKWTAKEVLGHLSDSERIFAYRALRIARGDGTPLPSFEQDEYVAAGQANGRALADLLGEWRAVRDATVTLFSSFGPET